MFEGIGILIGCTTCFFIWGHYLNTAPGSIQTWEINLAIVAFCVGVGVTLWMISLYSLWHFSAGNSLFEWLAAGILFGYCSSGIYRIFRNKN
jgi:hypothetical protein